MIGTTAGLPDASSAQSAYLVSAQVSALAAALQGSGYSNLGPGYGGEAQVRLTPGALSIGAGIQATHHEFALPGATFPVSLIGIFVEPRYVISTRMPRVGPYVSMRFATLRQRYRVAEFRGWSGGLTLNAGGGVLVSIHRRVNLEVGGTYGYTRFREFSIEDLTTGERTALPAGAGSNLIVRAGVAFGIWGTRS